VPVLTRLMFAVVTDTPQYRAIFSSTRQVGKVRTLFLLLLVYTWRFTWFTTSLASLRMIFTLLCTGRHLLVQFVKNLKSRFMHKSNQNRKQSYSSPKHKTKLHFSLVCSESAYISYR
jgi:Na+/melibiose symporter-like transporter